LVKKPWPKKIKEWKPFLPRSPFTGKENGMAFFLKKVTNRFLGSGTNPKKIGMARGPFLGFKKGLPAPNNFNLKKEPRGRPFRNLERKPGNNLKSWTKAFNKSLFKTGKGTRILAKILAQKPNLP